MRDLWDRKGWLQETVKILDCGDSSGEPTSNSVFEAGELPAFRQFPRFHRQNESDIPFIGR